MDIQTQKKLDYLEETKQLLRAAIEEKGQTINDSDSFRSYVDKVRAITTGSGSADLRYVTFKDDTGTVEYGKKAVADGDDCADPIARGIFSTPTKASTAQYNYTFAGWATTPGGGIDSNALKAVNEDRTVYANFISAVRYYTITYYDSDGVTILKTESLAYGAMPSYKPEKDGYKFDSWSPALSTVTGNINYTAQWVESVAFADAPWETIAAKSADGTASQMWNIGDTKDFVFNGETLKVAIADFNHDNLADGSGKAGISLVLMSLPSERVKWATNSYYLYSGCELKKTLENWVDYLPDSLKAVIKTVNKPCNASKSSGSTTVENVPCKLWPLTATELGWNGSNQYLIALGSRYPLFPSVGSNGYYPESVPVITVTINGQLTADQYWLRQTFQSGSINPTYAKYYSGGKGMLTFQGDAFNSSNTYKVRFGFCI